jgi:hypothetical protein
MAMLAAQRTVHRCPGNVGELWSRPTRNREHARWQPVLLAVAAATLIAYVLVTHERLSNKVLL